jgi:hypothetical protein
MTSHPDDVLGPHRDLIERAEAAHHEARATVRQCRKAIAESARLLAAAPPHLDPIIVHRAEDGVSAKDVPAE